MAVFKYFLQLKKDTRGDAVIEAAILFPVIIMVFAMLVLLSIYLPQAANLQRAVTYAATVVAKMQSDSGFAYETVGMKEYFDIDSEGNVYANLFKPLSDAERELPEEIVRYIMQKGLAVHDATFDISEPTNSGNFIFREVEITATETIQVPSVIRFIVPRETIVITRSARCPVLDGDEFVRNVDIAVDIVEELAERFEAVQKVLDFFKF